MMSRVAKRRTNSGDYRLPLGSTSWRSRLHFRNSGRQSESPISPSPVGRGRPFKTFSGLALGRSREKGRVAGPLPASSAPQTPRATGSDPRQGLFLKLQGNDFVEDTGFGRSPIPAWLPSGQPEGRGRPSLSHDQAGGGSRIVAQQVRTHLQGLNGQPARQVRLAIQRHPDGLQRLLVAQTNSASLTFSVASFALEKTSSLLTKPSPPRPGR